MNMPALLSHDPWSLLSNVRLRTIWSPVVFLFGLIAIGFSPIAALAQNADAKASAQNLQSSAGTDDLGLMELFGTPTDDVLHWTSPWLAQNPDWMVSSTGNSLVLHGFKVKPAGSISLPRLATPIIGLRAEFDGELCPVDLMPLPAAWRIRWRAPVQADPEDTFEISITIDCQSRPVTLEQSAQLTQQADGMIILPGHHAVTSGDSVRYEPLPQKNTVGYWTSLKDKVVWEFSVDQPGRFAVAALAGCGAGQGGSEIKVRFAMADDASKEIPPLEFTSTETGHFQNFRWQQLGFVDLDAKGKYSISIQASAIAKNAVFDVRTVNLIRQAAK